MRIWDISPDRLCRRHLLGEHSELHALWNVLAQGKKGYSRHPETLRWEGKLRALFSRHEELAKEMQRRGYHHQSPLDARQARGRGIQDETVDSPEKQRRILRARGCGCRV